MDLFRVQAWKLITKLSNWGYKPSPKSQHSPLMINTVFDALFQVNKLLCQKVFWLLYCSARRLSRNSDVLCHITEYCNGTLYNAARHSLYHGSPDQCWAYTPHITSLTSQTHFHKNYLSVSAVANQDPVAVIMGPAFASVGGLPGGNNTLLEVHKQLARERALGGERETADELDSSFRLMLLINSLDLKLLHSSVKQMGKYV